MKLYDSISANGVIQKMDEVCDTNATSFSIRKKIGYINDALDRYCHLAFKHGSKFEFDDINKTSPPIDKQSIVSGTNRYKFSDFTEKIINLVKLEALNADGNGIELIPENINSLATNPRFMGDSARTFQELYIDAESGTPQFYCKYGDYIYLRPNPSYSETDGLIAYFNRPAVKYDPVDVTISNASPGVFTSTAHGMSANDIILLFSDGSLPTGLTTDTVYYVVATVATDTFSVASTKGGTAINTSSAGSGIHSYIHISKIPGIPLLHHKYLWKHASLPQLLKDNKPQATAIASLIREEEMEIADHFSDRSKDERSIMSARIRSFR